MNKSTELANRVGLKLRASGMQVQRCNNSVTLPHTSVNIAWFNFILGLNIISFVSKSLPYPKAKENKI